MGLGPMVLIHQTSRSSSRRLLCSLALREWTSHIPRVIIQQKKRKKKKENEIPRPEASNPKKMGSKILMPLKQHKQNRKQNARGHINKNGKWNSKGHLNKMHKTGSKIPKDSSQQQRTPRWTRTSTKAGGSRAGRLPSVYQTTEEMTKLSRLL